MRSIFTFLLAMILLNSCKGYHEPQPTPDTPKALQPSSGGSFSKRYGNDDLVNELYAELASKDTALKALEEQISMTEGRDDESLADFGSFDNRNKNFYNSATGHIRSIQDSLIRKRMTNLINGSQTQYVNRTLAFHDLISKIGDRKNSMNDLHELLKIVKTLPAMDKYQRENEPSSKPAESFLKELEKLIQKLEAATNK